MMRVVLWAAWLTFSFVVGVALAQAPMAFLPNARPEFSIAPIVSAAAEGSHIIKATAGSLYGFDVTTGASAGVIMVFDSATVPADGAVTPVKCYDIAATATLSLLFGLAGGPPLKFNNGIVIVFSTGTNCFSKAVSATAFISAEAM